MASETPLEHNIKELEAEEEVEDVTLNSFILSPSTYEDAGIDRWNKPDEIKDLRAYCESLHIYEIGKKGDTDEIGYVRKMVVEILR